MREERDRESMVNGSLGTCSGTQQSLRGSCLLDCLAFLRPTAAILSLPPIRLWKHRDWGGLPPPYLHLCLGTFLFRVAYPSLPPPVSGDILTLGWVGVIPACKTSPYNSLLYGV